MVRSDAIDNAQSSDGSSHTSSGTDLERRNRADEGAALLGQARFGRYLDDAAGDVDLAIALCQWNQRFAGILHSQLGYVELAVRNTLDRQLRELSFREKGSQDWCLPGNAPDLVNRLIRGTLHDANDRARADARQRVRRGSHRANAEVIHDDVLSQLMWGTWVKLIGNPETSEKTLDQQELWMTATRNAFPYASDGETGRIKTSLGLQYIRRVRNNEAHYDNLYKEARNVNKIIGTSMSLLNSINPAFTQNWIDTAALRRAARELNTILSAK
ncbi:hypothetical protein EMO92_10095 [Bifidobacterium reuteri]|uniref:Abi-like protein n=3 Tax=Bifidobacterium TaxID=1678 RepID=A0A2M9HQ96_9BIFI|nr:MULTISPECIES: hypothetical protein [Bifidobacterium]KAA8823367.1 hypothetical protein EMO92_10095 [Bifidobacterium reuteri]KFI50766.1 Ycg4K [Bifidobacterium biavatii DSM 23969]PJM78994.1 hypothetical protein CUU80_06530 [Bifidobacterium scaligerum]